jgi:hypothetical protein
LASLKRRRLIAIFIVLVLAAGAAAYWFVAVPDQIASDYRSAAQPEHARLAGVMETVESTFTASNFSSGNYRKVNRAPSPERFLRAYRRESRDRKRRLRVPAGHIARGREALKTVDRARLLSVDSKPLLGGSDGVKASTALADQELAYLRAARRTLDEYDEVVKQLLAYQRVEDRVATTLARGLGAFPSRAVTDPKQLTRPLDRLARRLRPYRRAYRRLSLPPEMRADRAVSAASITVIVQELRRTSRAYANFDNAGAQAAQARLSRRIRRLSKRRRGSLSALVGASATRRAFDDLQTRDQRIRRAYEEL